MSAVEDARITAEARRATAARPGGMSRYERAVQRYLSTTQHTPAPAGESAPPVPSVAVAAGESAPPAPPVRSVAVAPDRDTPADGVGVSAIATVGARFPDLGPCPPGAVVVGIDDDSSSDAAMGWAAEEAERRDATLHLVHCFDLPAMAWQPEYRLYAGDLLDRARQSAADRLAVAEQQIRVARPGLPVVASLVNGRAAQVLRSASDGARLTVVGHSPASRGSRVLLGSVSLSVVSRCPAPVVVVGPDSARRSGPVVVGFDGSAASQAAVGVAMEEATVRGEQVIAVHAWNDADRDANRLHQLMSDPRELEEQERTRVLHQLAPWQERFPDVPLRAVVDRARPATALLRQGGTAGLLVVGTRGRGGLAGLLLGSTSHMVASYSTCPVMVVGAGQATASDG
ncbi:universal stress protein [Nakamurella flava]|nr:universal stress protein [Nakamurella flava]